jgi:prepilin-type N-terminal cleavage/methylation domain-containing protein
MSGFSLLEVMIAMALLSFALLQLLPQAVKVQTSMAENHFRTIAMHQAVSLAERLRVNKDVEFQQREIREWQNETTSLLPKGTSCVIPGPHACHCEITWQYRSAQCLKITLPL